MANSRYISAGILLDGVHERITLDTLDGAQTPCNERAAPGSRHADDSEGISTISYVCTEGVLTSYLLTGAIQTEPRILP